MISSNTGYVIDDVLVDNSSIGAVSSYTFDSITSDHTITATFREDLSAELVTLSSGETPFKVYPMPADDSFIIQFNDLEPGGILSILRLNGSIASSIPVHSNTKA
jgi:hypothetical protein